MDCYLRHINSLGVESLVLHDVPLQRIGKYAVIDIRDLEARFPKLNFLRRDPGPHLDVVHTILHAFRERMHLRGVNGMLYDDRAEGPGMFRVFPRFYSDDLTAARIPWEFQCGTGGIAVTVALINAGRLPLSPLEKEITLEWGSMRTTPDPYGIRTSTIKLEVIDRVPAKASFSHSVVEILAEGILTLPAY